MQNYTRNGWRRYQFTLETSVKRSIAFVLLNSGECESPDFHTRKSCHYIFQIFKNFSDEENSICLEFLCFSRFFDNNYFFENFLEIFRNFEGLENVEKCESKSQWAQVKLHSKRVEKMSIHTRNELRRWQVTLKTSGEDVNSHSKRVDKSKNKTNTLHLSLKEPLSHLIKYLFRRRLNFPAHLSCGFENCTDRSMPVHAFYGDHSARGGPSR
jgi:hypothetical protein